MEGDLFHMRQTGDSDDVYDLREEDVTPYLNLLYREVAHWYFGFLSRPPFGLLPQNLYKKTKVKLWIITISYGLKIPNLCNEWL